MRFHRVNVLLGCAAFALVAAVGYCCGTYGQEETLAAGAKVPGRVHRSVIHGNLLVALLRDNRLVTVDLTTGAAKTLATIELPAPTLDVAGGKVCIASKNRVMIVNLADGKMTEAGICDHPVTSLGFLTPDRVYVQGGPQIKVLDLTSGKPVYETSLGKADSRRGDTGFRTLGRSGTQLFISVVSEKDAVAVFDLEKGQVSDRISAAELRYNSGYQHPIDLCFAGDNVYILSSRLGYGLWTESLGVFDLKTRKFTAMKIPGKGLQGPALVPGPDGTVILTTLDGAFQFDATGKLNATLVSLNDTRSDAIVLGVWQGKALVSIDGTLRQVPMAATTAKAK